MAVTAHGLAVERGLGKPILSSLHAVFSLGGLAGVGAARLAASAGPDPCPHFVGSSAELVGLPGALVLVVLATGSHGAARGKHRRGRWSHVICRDV